jgi:lipopolysaccharide transport system ATP-binding protein
MADDIVIRAEGLGKKYVIGHQAQRERYVALRDVVARGARSALRKAAQMAKGRIGVRGDTAEEFWALKDVSFEVKRGEVLGVIGRNGAGKSTLLKILSRITEPTAGRVTIKGRVSSLLEVGTGFHPELTGRENIYLNGAILGMTRAEIKRKFDEIVAFAEVEKFLDTPVKRYSSGMYVRLAFAVAAHLEPEILVIDEVLAVGDIEFQKKCLGKMRRVAEAGRTVLFVSHQLGMVIRLCTEAMILDRGTLAYRSTASQAIEHYTRLISERQSVDRCSVQHQGRDGSLLDVHLSSTARKDEVTFLWHDTITVEVDIYLERSPGGMLLGVAVDAHDGTRVTTYVARLADYIKNKGGRFAASLEIPPKIIAPGEYMLTIALFEHGVVYHQRENECHFSIVDSGSEMAEFSGTKYGVVILPGKWNVADKDHSG